jgi:hypothetical protein
VSVISSSTVLRRSGEPLSAPLGEALAMMDVDAGRYYILDDVATFVWHRLATPTSVADLVAELQRRYDVERERCEADVLPFLRRLHEKRLVLVEA